LPAGARGELRLGLLAFLLPLAGAGYVLLARRPLLFLGGLTDEWLGLGWNLALHGTLGWGDEPILLRPPGYPAFLAGLLRLFTRVPPRLTDAYTQSAAELVGLAQATLLAATSALLFVWLRRRVGDAIAFGAALVYGLCPYALVLPGLLHYDVAHLFLLVAGCAALDVGLARASSSLLPLLGAGALWGIAALLRPVTLPLPAFVALMLLARGPRGRRGLLAWIVFSAAMAATVAPWTLRNFRVSGRLVPINVQGWAAVWGSTVVPLRLDPDEYQWRAVGATHMQPLFRRVTGEDYSYLGFLKHNVALEAAFKQDALENMARRPRVYLWNVARGLLSLTLQLNTSLVSVFQRIQRSGETVSQAWFWAGAERERAPTLASRAMAALHLLLLALAALGIATGAFRRDTFLLVPGLVFACVAGAHALTFFDYTYYYLKLPFLVAFAALGLASLRRVGPALGAALAALAAAASLAMLFGP
jgi:hypothetical protein